MYQRILLPLDLSREHDAVFEAAARLVAPESGAILLLHVIEIIPGFRDEEMEDFYAPLRGRAQAMLDEWSEALRGRGLETRCDLRTGKRGPSIVRYATEEVCDLIAVASRAADPDRPGWGFGTTSHQIALMAPCSVLLVR